MADLAMYDSDSSDDELLFQLIHTVRSEKKIKRRPDHINELSDLEFFIRFRLKKETVRYLLHLIHDQLECVSNRWYTLSPLTQLLLTLRYYACGSFLVCIGDFSGVDKSTVSRVVAKVSMLIASLSKFFIKLPTTVEEILEAQQQFHRIAAFPRVLGALDCTHVRIVSPGGDDAEEYRCRKGYFSFNVQALCSADLKIIDIVARWPGAAHDQTIFNNSALKKRLLIPTMREARAVVLGDSGYLLTNTVITPFRTPDTPAKNLFNESQIRTRNPIERCFGVWKRRFPVLAYTLRLKVDTVEAVIVACAVLHNIAIEMKEEVPPPTYLLNSSTARGGPWLA